MAKSSNSTSTLESKKTFIVASKGFILFFVFILLVDLIAIYKYPGLQLIVKPLIMSSIMGFYVSKVEHQDTSLLTAMLFALLGDILIMFESDFFFQLGLSCFLIMQLLYIKCFNRYTTTLSSQKKRILILLYIMASAFIIVAFPKLGNMLIPVVLYCIALMSMATFALMRKSSHTLGPLAIGALLFVISDFLLAIDKFVQAMAILPALVIITYAAAQFLIVNEIVAEHTEK
jgi:uncharacterized membrane protein YhhN